MPADRTYAFPELHQGMDHDHYDWSPLNATRAKIEWPKKARVALCVIVALEHAEWKLPPDSYQVPKYIRASIDAVTRATGRQPIGWLGPESGESGRTPQLLAQSGIRYVCDWVNDEQPYRMKVPEGELHALPVSLPLDDINALWDRRIDIDQYGTMIRETFETLYREGADNGRLLVVTLHPFLIGQPFRIGCLDAALDYIVKHDGVWAATGSEVIEWCRNLRVEIN